MHIVESWESPDAFPSTQGNTTRSSIHAYTNAAHVELLVNGKDIFAEVSAAVADWKAQSYRAAGVQIGAVLRDDRPLPGRELDKLRQLLEADRLYIIGSPLYIIGSPIHMRWPR